MRVLDKAFFGKFFIYVQIKKSNKASFEKGFVIRFVRWSASLSFFVLFYCLIFAENRVMNQNI